MHPIIIYFRIMMLSLVQRSVTLVLMMINSYSYSTNDLVLFKFQILIEILVDV